MKGYKRLEIYVGWTCNQKCTYCMEFENMEKSWDKKVTKYEILKKLIKYKRDGYNHVTYLGGEPFIQPVFLDALKLGKKLGYTILVATNCTTLHLEKEAKKYLPYIDELIISIEALDNKVQQEISRTKVIVYWEEVFHNINMFWQGKMLKANIVITQANKNILLELINYLINKKIKNIAITYPDIAYTYYGKDFVLEKIAPSYKEALKDISDIVEICEINMVNLKLPDFPFCVLPRGKINKYIKLTDDFDYSNRLKINYNGEIYDRNNISDEDELPRERSHVYKCDLCVYNKICWGISRSYEKLYGLNEIKPILIN